MKKYAHMIWTDDPYLTEYIEDYKKRLEEEIPGELDGYTESEIYQRMAEENADWLDDERCNLDIDLNYPIIAIVDLGFWNGRHTGYSVMRSTNLKDCLYGHCRGGDSYNTFYVSDDGEFCQDETHHDGTNHYMYRIVRDDLADDEYGEFLERLKYGDATEEEVMQNTKSLGPTVSKVYGWILENAKSAV